MRPNIKWIRERSIEIDVQVISREFIGNELTYDYDPMAADPDFLVIGQFGNLSKIYDQAPDSGDFRLVKSIQSYEIYARNE